MRFGGGEERIREEEGECEKMKVKVKVKMKMKAREANEESTSKLSFRSFRASAPLETEGTIRLEENSRRLPKTVLFFYLTVIAVYPTYPNLIGQTSQSHDFGPMFDCRLPRAEPRSLK